MSLATTGGVGGGAGGAGITMAHHAGAVGPVGAAPQGAQDHAKFSGSARGPAPPPSVAALGADILDKQQGLTMRQVKNISHLPIVALDLHASEPILAMFPKKPEDTAESVPPLMVGKMKASLRLKATETSRKTLRKWLSDSKPYSAVVVDCWAKWDEKNAVTIERPQRWVGVRRTSDAPDCIQSQVTTEPETPAIAEEASLLAEPGTTMVNSTLDGVGVPQNDDFDRVVCKVRLVSSKKAVTLLPEEGVKLLINQAQNHVAAKIKEKNEEEILNYPCAVALPAWCLHDAAVEALYDATGSSGVFFQRSVCALAGSLLPNPADGSKNQLLERILEVRKAMADEHQRRKARDPDAEFEEDMLLLLYGMAADGFECTAIQIRSVQQKNACCVFGDYNVLSSVSYPSSDPLSKMESCSQELEAALDVIAPEADGPAAIVMYGTAAEQSKIKAKWDEIKSKQKEWKKVPLMPTRPDCVAMGAAVLGGVSHGRSSITVEREGAKPKPGLAIRVQNVAPVAVGVRMNYHGDAPSKWTPIKTIFGFDRRIPAGPYQIDLKASECVVYRNGGADMSDEEFIKATKDNEGSKKIPVREEAALNLRVQIFQKWSRDGEWIKVGDPMSPLVSVKNGPDDDEEKIACESVTLELSVGVTGMISTNKVGDG